VNALVAPPLRPAGWHAVLPKRLLAAVVIVLIVLGMSGVVLSVLA
jgi:hypothetical protein